MDIGIGNSLVRGHTKAASVPAQEPVVARIATIEDKPRPVPAAAPADVSREPVEQAVTSIQNFMQTIRRDLNFSLDDSTGRMVIKVTDSTSGDVIRQLPSEEALRLAESLEEVRSLLFKAEA
ncbi:flagellar protein FlaG [Phytopseudomonas dryadis]|uniref:Flagellar biosynthesis protein FlaG n=1 Tax=Phytopseudomonas dryadis TaxID=2487520 RepID=A0ABY1Z918_9GAMM|nr:MULTISPECIES: flagellar protein FlaG [Pseudomonas]TBV07940.1 flagellar biosynthesis protein FlaG [Pseudomonas dryadis]TBV19335.1 flagellar biosynthesis protein FlaG [Pseudomonas sp. FRB 230]